MGKYRLETFFVEFASADELEKAGFIFWASEFERNYGEMLGSHYEDGVLSDQMLEAKPMSPLTAFSWLPMQRIGIGLLLSQI